MGKHGSRVWISTEWTGFPGDQIDSIQPSSSNQIFPFIQYQNQDSSKIGNICGCGVVRFPNPHYVVHTFKVWWYSYSDSLLLWLSCHVMRKVSAFLFYLPFDQCLQVSIWTTVFPSNSLFTLQSSCGLTQSLTQKPFRGKTNCANNSLDRAIWVRDDTGW